ncbi:MAG: hypothetical protein ACK4ND_15845 [Cytophagaceae bacterium]
MKNTAFFILFLGFIAVLSSCGKSKSDTLARKWKLTEAEFAGNKLASDQVSAVYLFNSDGTFEITSEGMTDDGLWTLNEETNMLTLEYNDENRKLELHLDEISNEKVKMSWEEFTMKYAATLSPAE